MGKTYISTKTNLGTPTQINFTGRGTCNVCGKILSKKTYNYCSKHRQLGDRNPYWKGGKVKATCKFCGKNFSYYKTVSTGKFCSHRCYTDWNKKTKRYADKKNPRWKGDEVGYDALHTWVSRNLGKPSRCISCNKVKKKYVWANKSYEYKRELGDWIPMCYSCHRKRDYKYGWKASLRRYPERKLL